MSERITYTYNATTGNFHRWMLIAELMPILLEANCHQHEQQIHGELHKHTTALLR